MARTSAHHRRGITWILGLVLAFAALLTFAQSASAGVYTLQSRYAGDAGATRGWTVEWRVPEVTNPSAGTGAVGQWYDNLESGIYFFAGAWHVYFYGDDDGIEGYDPNFCSPNWFKEETQRYIGGWCAAVAPGAQLVFKYEYCNRDHTVSVNGTQRCLWVDMKDGVGYRFLAEDDKRNPAEGGPEMYAHDVETFEDSGQTAITLSCTNPLRMVGQSRKTTSGAWVTMTGATTWTFSDDPGNHYDFRNQRLTAVPATWEVCSV